MKKAIEQKVQEEINSCDRLMGWAFNPREGYNAKGKAQKSELESKIRSLESYLPRIRDKSLREQCKSTIRQGRAQLKQK
ncbi:hypothetical protein [uncultured Maribacter sp.]|uniref:hypothetical protein n=1 Tax=uncultured Maribacter sp. TaxID=431308 RepID=UPI002629D5D3|nr:hypothetical protein [uncultured Maribacter sp.]